MIEGKDEGGGGTCLYIRNDLEYKTSTEVCSNNHIEIQSTTLTGEREGQQLRPIEVVLIYRPPKGNDRRALELIHEFIGKIVDIEKKDLIIMGDLNWNLLNKKGTGSKMINEILEEYSLQSHIVQATRIKVSQESLLDVM